MANGPERSNGHIPLACEVGNEGFRGSPPAFNFLSFPSTSERHQWRHDDIFCFQFIFSIMPGNRQCKIRAAAAERQYMRSVGSSRSLTICSRTYKLWPWASFEHAYHADMLGVQIKHFYKTALWQPFTEVASTIAFPQRTESRCAR